MDYENFFNEEIKTLKDEGLYRTFRAIDRVQNMFPKALETVEGNDREVEIWCSNDYLGMGQHPKVLDAMHEALDSSGAGAGGTRNISGTTHAHVLLEQELAVMQQ